MIDYGLLSLFALQILIAVAASVLFVRLQISVQRIREAEIAYRHTADSIKDQVARVEKSYENHRAKVKDLLAGKLDFELADDKLRAEIKRLSSRLTYIAKRVDSPAEEADTEPPQADPPLYYDPAAGPPAAKPETKNGVPPDFGRSYT